MLTVLARKVRDMETDLKSLSQKLGLNFDPDGPLGEDERVFRLCSLTVLSHCALSLCSLTVLSHCALSLCLSHCALCALRALSVLSHYALSLCLSHCALSLSLSPCSLTVLSRCALSLCALSLCALSVLSHCVSLFDLYLLSVTVISL
jgi:hypothetical protein